MKLFPSRLCGHTKNRQRNEGLSQKDWFFLGLQKVEIGKDRREQYIYPGVIAPDLALIHVPAQECPG